MNLKMVSFTMGTGPKMGLEKDMEFNYGKMARNMKVIGTMIWQTEKVV